jgi:hypothetical protein
MLLVSGSYFLILSEDEWCPELESNQHVLANTGF